jgi:hypothetical protein
MVIMSTAMAPLIFAIFLVIFTAFVAWLVLNQRPGGDPRVARRYRVIVTWPLMLYLMGNVMLHQTLGLQTGIAWDGGGVILFFIVMMMLEAIE